MASRYAGQFSQSQRWVTACAAVSNESCAEVVVSGLAVELNVAVFFNAKADFLLEAGALLDLGVLLGVGASI
jgi:hypothetical protein